MNEQCSTETTMKKRWIPISEFCEQYGISLSTARYWKSQGKLKIKPKKKANERVYVDLVAYHKEWFE